MKVNQGGRPRKVKPVPIDAIMQSSNISPYVDPELSSMKVPQMDILQNQNFCGTQQIDLCDDVINKAERKKIAMESNVVIEDHIVVMAAIANSTQTMALTKVTTAKDKKDNGGKETKDDI